VVNLPEAIERDEMKNRFRKLAVLMSTLALAGTVQATNILSSYSAGNSDQTGPMFSVTDEKWESFGFKTGSDGTYSVDSVTMRMSGLVAGEVAVSIYDSVTRSSPCEWAPGGICSYIAPGQSIGALESQSVQAKADYKFDATTNISLSPSTLYWVVFRGAGSQAINYYEYQYPGDPWYSPFRSETGAKIHDFMKSPGYGHYVGGVNIPGVLGQDWSVHSGLNLLQVEGTIQAIPEPSTVWLMLIGFIAVTRACLKRAACSEQSRSSESDQRSMAKP
jgi:hypothetical protein